MARKKVIDLNADTTIGFEKPGQTVSGYYVGAKPVKTKYGTSQLHHLQSDTGMIGVWGSQQLDSKLASIPKGSMVYIKYLKKIQVKNGSMKTFDVEFDDEESIDVSNIEVNYQAGAATEEEPTPDADANEAQDVDPDEPDADEEKDVDQTPPPPPVKKGTATEISAAQKAKAAALLNKQRSKVA